jgi:hypothetical protein
MAKTSPSRSLNGREARADQIFPFFDVITRVPRPATLSVAAAAGIVFTISGRFQQMAIVHDPNAAGSGQRRRRHLSRNP